LIKLSQHVLAVWFSIRSIVVWFVSVPH